jgi:hypothetical protein
MMFGSVSEHFANFRHIQRCNTCVSGLNALFWDTEVAMHPIYSGRPKMMFGSVETISKTSDIKDENLCFGHECTILGYRSWEASILLH